MNNYGAIIGDNSGTMFSAIDDVYYIDLFKVTVNSSPTSGSAEYDIDTNAFKLEAVIINIFPSNKGVMANVDIKVTDNIITWNITNYGNYLYLDSIEIMVYQNAK